MKGTTHLAVGLAAASVIPNQSWVNIVCMAIGSLLPDIDKSTSLLGRHIPVLPKLIPHRSITHGLILAAAVWFINPYLSVGCALHLLLDMCNPDGVPLFWPLPIRIRIPCISRVIRSGGWVDRIFGYVLWTFVVVYSALQW